MSTINDLVTSYELSKQLQKDGLLQGFSIFVWCKLKDAQPSARTVMPRNLVTDYDYIEEDCDAFTFNELFAIFLKLDYRDEIGMWLMIEFNNAMHDGEINWERILHKIAMFLIDERYKLPEDFKK